jgi:MFS superfamily sulfate permease-like transporter
MGTANLAAGLFLGIPVSTSGSRPAWLNGQVRRRSSPESPGAALIILMIVLIPSLFHNLPQPALAVLSVTSTREREPLMISSASEFAECLPVNLRVPAA